MVSRAVVPLGALVALVSTAVAIAEGPSIKEATPVRFGHEQSGDIANGALDTPCSAGRDGARGMFWTLRLDTGDVATIDWENENYAVILVYHPDVNDFNLQDAGAAGSFVGAGVDAGKHELKVAATASGRYPLEFCADQNYAAPYTFTATVEHGLALSLGRVAGELPASGTLRVSVRTPDGDAVNDSDVEVDLKAVKKHAQKLKTIGTATASRGYASISYTVPKSFRGKDAKIQAVAHGSGYLTETSKFAATAFED